MERRLLTREVVDEAISIIQFYTGMDLTCDERDPVFKNMDLMLPYVKGFTMSWSNTETTLGKSIALLLPVRGGPTDESLRLISSIARACNPAVEDLGIVMPHVRPNIFFSQIVDYEICIEKISSVAKAILTRSLEDLKTAIRSSPESLLEQTRGLTVLHLSIDWPRGLELLLTTDAKSLLDTPNGSQGHLSCLFSYAAVNRCAKSLGLLLQAGCDLYPDDVEGSRTGWTLCEALSATSAECAEVFAIEMARRRQQLFALAKSNMNKIKLLINYSDIGEDIRKVVMAAIAAIEHYSDPGQARSNATGPGPRLPKVFTNRIIVWALEHAKIPLPVALRQSGLMDDRIYWFRGLPLAYWEIFERHGFTGWNQPNEHGLRPIMGAVQWQRWFANLSFSEQIQPILPWLIEHECLNARPAHIKEQPEGLRPDVMIDTGATGWHYLAGSFVDRTWGQHQQCMRTDRPMFDADTHLMATIADGEAKQCLDDCVCWCTLPQQSGHGCSPFSYLCKRFLHYDEKFDPFDPRSFQHHLFRHRCNGSDVITSTLENEGSLATTNIVPTWQLEFLRILTFEALEMTHTCCMGSWKPLEGKYMVISAKKDPENAQQELLTDPSVEERVWLLDELMVEFTEQLGRRTGAPHDLEDFVFGPWRARMAGLYAVDADEIKAMDCFLGGKVKTKVLPEPLRIFFGNRFSFFDDRQLTMLRLSLTSIGPSNEVPRCIFCFSD
ncbi:hypothetical protein F4859DRAFT_33198 [Xylaria cf. heliscus]|nr:hypothetical protein F4859DRAFT_33198 [Xylaria cf. heliscus]